jgi:hypothetical protein
MEDLPVRKMSDPAPEQREVERADAHALEQREPDIHHEGCADADQRDPDQVLEQKVHGGHLRLTN